MKNHDEQIKDFEPIEAKLVESHPVEARLLENTQRQEAQETAESAASPRSTVTLEEILQRMDRVIEQGEHIMESIDRISQIQHPQPSGQWGMGLGHMIDAREATNRKVLSLLEKMYDDLRPRDQRRDEAPPEEPTDQSPMDKRIDDFVSGVVEATVEKTVSESLKSSLK